MQAHSIRRGPHPRRGQLSRKVPLRRLQLPTSSTSRRGGYSYGFDLRLDPIRLDHVGALKWLSTEEHDLEDSQQTIDPTRKDVGNCKGRTAPSRYNFASSPSSRRSAALIREVKVSCRS